MVAFVENIENARSLVATAARPKHVNDGFLAAAGGISIGGGSQSLVDLLTSEK